MDPLTNAEYHGLICRAAHARPAPPRDRAGEFADYVSEIYGFTKALEDAIAAMVVFGVVGPLVGGFLWVGLLWLFAGVIVWLALALTVILLLVMTILCYVKAGLAPSLTSALGLDGAASNISICNAPQSDDARSTPSPREQREREGETSPHRGHLCA